MLSLHTEFQCPTMLGTGLKLCVRCGGGLILFCSNTLISIHILSKAGLLPNISPEDEDFVGTTYIAAQIALFAILSHQINFMNFI